MKWKQFLQAVLFIILFFCILIPLTYIIRTNGEVKDRFVGFYAEKKNTIDVITIGSSPVFPGVSAPQMWGEYGFTMYPLSTHMQRPKAATYLIKEAEKTQNPKLYIFELRQYTMPESAMLENPAHTRGVTDNLKYSWNRVQAINALIEDKSERHYYYFDIFKYHSNWKTLVLPSQLRTLFYEYPDDLKGFVINDNIIPNEAEDYSDITTVTPIPEEEEVYLRELLSYLKENNMEAFFYVSPYKYKEVPTQKEMFNYMEQIIAEYGYETINMNDNKWNTGINFETDFCDLGDHTNSMGAEKCSAFLGQYIKDNYELEDKRGLEEYKSWDKAYELYQAELKKAKDKIQMRLRLEHYSTLGEE